MRCAGEPRGRGGKTYPALPSPACGAGCAWWNAASFSTQAATSACTGDRPVVQRRTVVCRRPVRRASSRSVQPITARQTSNRCDDIDAPAALGSASDLLFLLRVAGLMCSK
jgi:hypothetical protein